MQTLKTPVRLYKTPLDILQNETDILNGMFCGRNILLNIFKTNSQY
jgi:hypothetical protein